MRKVLTAELPPATCLICGGSNGDREYFLDMERIEDWHGSVYYCSQCFLNMAETVGYVRSDEGAMRMIQAELHDLREMYDRFSNLFDRLLVSGIDCYALLDFLYSKDSEEPTYHRERGEIRRKARMARNAARTPEPGDGEGRDDISSISGSGLVLDFGGTEPA